MTEPQPRLVLGTTPRQWAALGTAFALLLALLIGFAVGRSSAPLEAVSDPVDLGFARDMRTHHAQAVEMASIAHERATDPTLRYVAFDIMTTQQGQIGLMTGWLQLWKQSQTDTSQPVMAWMGDEHAGHMPGMATRAQVAALRSLPVPRMEEEFLRLMIRHHRGALPMADFARENATSPDIRDLAAKMSKGQASEIDLMQSMLGKRGLKTEPEDRTPKPSEGPTAPGHGGHG